MSKLIIGCGYLGTTVARRWSRRAGTGHKVWATTRTPSRAAELKALGLEPVICDVLQPRSLEALPAVESIVYCVGLDRSSGQSMSRRAGINGLANVLARLQQQPDLCEKFIYISSTGVYGQTGGEWVDETSAVEPLTDSGRIVLEAERILSRDHLPIVPSYQGGTKRGVILRFAGIYGPGRLIRYEALKTGTPLAGPPDKWLNLIHVEDGASAVVAAAEQGEPGGVYNICDDEPVRRQEFFTHLAELIQATPPRFAPPRQTDVLKTHSGNEGGNRRISNRKMKAELHANLKYPTFREGLPASLLT